MKKIIEKKEGLAEARAGSFAKTVSKLSERVKRAASDAKFVQGQVDRAGRVKWGMDSMDLQELDGNLLTAIDHLNEAGILLDQFEGLLK